MAAAGAGAAASGGTAGADVNMNEEKIKEMFDLFDSDSGGTIDSDELSTAFLALGLSDSAEEIEKLVQTIDSDGSGVIEYPEFVEVMHELFASIDTAAEMSKAFSYMGEQKDRITVADLRKIAAEVNDEQPEAFLEEMLKAGDRDGDNAVTFADFRSMMEQAVQNERSGLDDPRRVMQIADQQQGARI